MSLTHKSFYEHLRVASHADQVLPGGVFVAIRGAQHNGIDFIPVALANGAKKVVVQSDEEIPRPTFDLISAHGAVLERVDDVRYALGQHAASAYGHPAKKLKIIGITGTKGKSTTAFLLEHILRSSGRKTALISTVYNSINGCALPPTGMTTPLPDYLHAFFAQCVEEGVEWVICEAAAQAFSMQRFVDVAFSGAIFTNFSQEHGEFYQSMEEYFAAKKKILVHLIPGSYLLLNRDDTYVSSLFDQCESSSFFACDDHFVCPSLIGSFNCYNSTAASYAARDIVGIDDLQICKALDSFVGVPGRLNRYVLQNGATAVIDYAHNPSSYEAVLGALRPLTSDLIVVFGCGGDRDRGKRPLMGALAAAFADYLIVTSDNPRSEDPAAIAEDIMRGIPRSDAVRCILNREEAIEYAITQRAKPGSMVVLLGKGPEEYQIIKGIAYPFSEKNIVSRYLVSL